MIPPWSEPAWIVALAAAIPLAITAFNLATWPTGRPRSVDAKVSALIPARNEAGNIGPAVRALLATGVAEVIVCDDGSTDGTGAEAAAAGARLIRGRPLPPGWVGKPHACHQLAEAATGELLLFVDADVRLQPDGVGRVLDLFHRWNADVVTAVPRQLTGTFAERLILPLLHLTYASWLPLLLVPATRFSYFLAANGQVLALRRSAYTRIGGFAAIRDAVVDDMAICRLAKRARLTVVFADGARIADCRMYRSARDVWEGFSKNVYPGLGNPILLLLALGLYAGAFLAGPAAVVAGLTVYPAALLPGVVACAANLTQRLALARRFDHPLDSALLHPLGVLGLGAIALNSFRWALTGRIRWRGRTYGGAVPEVEGA